MAESSMSLALNDDNKLETAPYSVGLSTPRPPPPATVHASPWPRESPTLGGALRPLRRILLPLASERSRLRHAPGLQGRSPASPAASPQALRLTWPVSSRNPCSNHRLSSSFLRFPAAMPAMLVVGRCRSHGRSSQPLDPPARSLRSPRQPGISLRRRAFSAAWVETLWHTKR